MAFSDIDERMFVTLVLQHACPAQGKNASLPLDATFIRSIEASTVTGAGAM
jgi:hypothetical protein